MNSKTMRDSNIELLRLVLMLLIVTMHVFLYQLAIIGSPSAYLTNSFLACFCIAAVNCYVFISGYYGIKVRLKSFLSFVLQTLFYSFAICFVASFTGDWKATSETVTKALFPLLSGKWWFATLYIVLYIISPLLNYSIDRLEKREFLIVLTGLLCFDCVAEILFGNSSLSKHGYSIFHFITIYCLARYFAKYDIKIKYPVLYYVIPTVILAIIIFIGYYVFQSRIYWNAFIYNNPLIIIAAIGLFYTFKSISIKSSFINKIAPLAFGVYLIHNDKIVFEKIIIPAIDYLSHTYAENLFLRISTLLLLCIIIFVVCLSIERIRVFICTPIINYINKKITK